MKLKLFLKTNGVSQAELAAGIGVTESFISMLCSEASSPSVNTINRALAWPTVRVGRPVMYEETFADSQEHVA